MKGPYKTIDETDPVSRMVRGMSAEDFVEWLVEYKGLTLTDREIENVVMNLREQYRWHRLQGRLDRHPRLAILAQLWGLRQSPHALASPRDGELG